MTDYDDLKERIRKAREKSKISQAKLAKLLGMTQQGYRAWEIGDSKPDNNQRFRLAEILKIEPEEFIPLPERYYKCKDVISLISENLDSKYMSKGELIEYLEFKKALAIKKQKR